MRKAWCAVALLTMFLGPSFFAERFIQNDRETHSHNTILIVDGFCRHFVYDNFRPLLLGRRPFEKRYTTRKA